MLHYSTNLTPETFPVSSVSFRHTHLGYDDAMWLLIQSCKLIAQILAWVTAKFIDLDS